MEKLIFLVFSLISLVNCNDFIVLSSPKSIVFKGSSDLPANALSEIYTAALGYSINANKPWDGLHVDNPFNVASAVVSVIVEDAEGLNFAESQKFSMIGGDENFEETVHSKVLDHSHLAVNVDLVHRHGDHILTTLGELRKSEDIQTQFLKSKEKGHREFLDEIQYLQSLTDVISSMKATPAFINIRLSMKSLSKTSSARAEATKLFTSTINKLNEVVQKKYGGNALFTIVAVDEHIPHDRVKRQINPNQGNETDNPYNIASLSSSDYPVIFNIILWFSLVFIFALLAISLALSNVEDKDSIIYRMTGARGKKDN